jgi:uncharacterized membrane-anchored protein
MKKWFFGIVALQLCFIAGEGAMYQLRVRTGDEVLLRVVPVDPRSLFMGHYMTLGYDISRLDGIRGPNGLTAWSKMRAGDTIWVGLRPHTPYAEVVSVSLNRPPGGSGIVYLRGKCASTRWGSPMMYYGIERYYIPEARQADANRLWGQIRSGQTQVAASISVGSNGAGIIRRLYANGAPLNY